MEYSTATGKPVYVVDHKGVKHTIKSIKDIPEIHEKTWVM